MTKPIFLTLLSAMLLLAMVVSGHADTIILKSGEMFQTGKTWREDGFICFDRNGKVMRYPEGQVERLIERGLPSTEKPTAPEKPATTFDRSAPAPLKDADNRALWRECRLSGVDMATARIASKGCPPSRKRPRVWWCGAFTPSTPSGSDVPAWTVFFSGSGRGGCIRLLVQVSNYLDFSDLKMEAFGRFGKGVEDRGYEDRFRWSTPMADRFPQLR